MSLKHKVLANLNLFLEIDLTFVIDQIFSQFLKGIFLKIQGISGLKRKNFVYLYDVTVFIFQYCFFDLAQLNLIFLLPSDFYSAATSIFTFGNLN
jgi:hypothetical protein